MTQKEIDNLTWLFGYYLPSMAFDVEEVAAKMGERWEFCIYPPRPVLYPGMWLVCAPEHYRANTLMAALFLALDGLRAREEGRETSSF